MQKKILEDDGSCHRPQHTATRDDSTRTKHGNQLQSGAALTIIVVFLWRAGDTVVLLSTLQGCMCRCARRARDAASIFLSLSLSLSSICICISISLARHADSAARASGHGPLQPLQTSARNRYYRRQRAWCLFPRQFVEEGGGQHINSVIIILSTPSAL